MNINYNKDIIILNKSYKIINKIIIIHIIVIFIFFIIKDMNFDIYETQYGIMVSSNTVALLNTTTTNIKINDIKENIIEQTYDLETNIFYLTIESNYEIDSIVEVKSLNRNTSIVNELKLLFSKLEF
ncbi:MAG: hypothetical protein R3Y21_03440 [Mycoplasmatota bacterium]